MTKAPDGALVMVGERGMIARSTDNGATWEVQKSGYTGSFYGVMPVPPSALLTYGMRGNVFRSGCTFTRGLGRIFYFSPGHETYPIYHRQDILQVLTNAAHWAGEFSAAERARPDAAPRASTAASRNEKDPAQPLR